MPIKCVYRMGSSQYLPRIMCAWERIIILKRICGFKGNFYYTVMRFTCIYVAQISNRVNGKRGLQSPYLDYRFCEGHYH